MAGPMAVNGFEGPCPDPAEIGGSQCQAHGDSDRLAEFGGKPLVQTLERNVDVGGSRERSTARVLGYRRFGDGRLG